MDKLRLEFNLRLDILYEVRIIQNRIWTNVLYMYPCKVRIAGDAEWSDDLEKSVLRTKLGAGNCDVDFLVSLPTRFAGEERVIRVGIKDLQSTHADAFFDRHYIKFVPDGDEIKIVAVRKGRVKCQGMLGTVGSASGSMVGKGMSKPGRALPMGK